MASDEERLQSELRTLAAKTRKVRQELRAMMASADTRDLTRGIAHTQSSLRPRRAAPAVAAHDQPVSRGAARKKR